ncbi:MAG: helix-turn-helix transcriptional regulator, partial [Nitrospiraceae bacterium]|nr:helix-turn-helix transcriptional regulator [Nitrospiraceae bacterium]
QRYVNRPALSTILSQGEHSANQIRKAVMDYGYSQKEMAEFLGVHYSTISRWVNKTSNARKKT